MIIFTFISFWCIITTVLLGMGINEPYQAVLIPLIIVVLCGLIGAFYDKKRDDRTDD